MNKSANVSEKNETIDHHPTKKHKTMGVQIRVGRSKDIKGNSTKRKEPELKSLSMTSQEKHSLSTSINKTTSSTSFVSTELKGKQHTSSDSKGKPNSSIEIKRKQISSSELKRKQISSSELKGKLISSSELKGKLISSSEIKTKLISTSDIKGKHNTSSELKEKQSSTSDIKRKQSSTSEVKGKQSSTSDLKGKPISSKSTASTSTPNLNKSSKSDIIESKKLESKKKHLPKKVVHEIKLNPRTSSADFEKAFLKFEASKEATIKENNLKGKHKKAIEGVVTSITSSKNRLKKKTTPSSQRVLRKSVVEIRPSRGNPPFRRGGNKKEKAEFEDKKREKLLTPEKHKLKQKPEVAPKLIVIESSSDNENSSKSAVSLIGDKNKSLNVKRQKQTSFLSTNKISVLEESLTLGKDQDSKIKTTDECLTAKTIDNKTDSKDVVEIILITSDCENKEKMDKSIKTKIDLSETDTDVVSDEGKSCSGSWLSDDSRPLTSFTKKVDNSNDGDSLVSASITTKQEDSKQRSRSSTKASSSSSTKKKQGSSKRNSSNNSISEDGSSDRTIKNATKIGNKSGIVFEIGVKLEAMDFQEKWYLAKIVEIDDAANEILIHFDGWSNRYDEWVSMSSKKLRSVSQKSTRKDRKHQTAKTVLEYKVDEKILGRWTDGKMYPATISEILPENNFTVVFYDGFSKKVALANIAKLPPDAVKLSFPLPLARVKKLQSDTEQCETKPIIKEPNLEPTIISSAIPKKQFVIEEDHNHFKCNVEGCNKGFRKESLLNSHTKHYHRSLKVKKTASTTLFKKIRRRRKPKLEEGKSTTDKSTINEPKDIVLGISIKVEAEEPSLVENLIDKTVSEPLKIELSANSKEIKQMEPLGVTNDINSPSPINEPLPNIDIQPAAPPLDLLPQKPVFPKGTYPITKMETRRAKLSFYREDTNTIFTDYKSVAFGHQNTRTPGGSRTEKIKSPKEPNSGLSNKFDNKQSGKIIKTDDSKTKSKNLNENLKSTDAQVKSSFPILKKSNNRRGEKRISDSQSGKDKFEISKKIKLETDIDDDIMEIKRQAVLLPSKRKHDRISESTVTSRADDVFDENELIELGDDNEEHDDEVVHCICEVNEENGLMIQCEICMTWQHGSCFNIEELEQVPEKYTCYACNNPRGLRESFKYRPDPDWFKSGQLPTFSCLGSPAVSIEKSNVLLTTHNLMTSMHTIVNVLQGMKHKINIIKSGSKDHQDLNHFSKPWCKTICKNANPLERISLNADETESVLNALAKEGLQPKIESPGKGFSFDHSYFSIKNDDDGLLTHKISTNNNSGKSGASSIDTKISSDDTRLASACSSTDSTSITTITTEDTEAVLDNLDYTSIPDPVVLDHGYADDFSDSEQELKIVEDAILASPPPIAASIKNEAQMEWSDQIKVSDFNFKKIEEIKPKTRRRGHRKSTNFEKNEPVYLPKVQEVIDAEVCRNNLSIHILEMQAEMEGKLSLIEKQLSALECENETKDEDELPKLLQSLKNYSDELGIMNKYAIRPST